MSSNDPSDIGGNEADDTPSPRQGRWLGAVRSWIGGSEGGDGLASGGSAAAPAAASSPALSADEIRRRRLEKMEGSRAQQVSSMLEVALRVELVIHGWGV